jgi:citrate lyase subunit beta/citryl-CoA lyase
VKSLRSLLSTPGNRTDMLEKALGYGADAIIVDLEDSVPDSRQAEGRICTREFIDSKGSQGIIYVRVNPAESELLEGDLEAIVAPGLVGIQLPKSSAPEHVRRADELLTKFEAERGLENGAIEILVSLESAKGVFHAHEILSASPRVGSVMPATAEHGDLMRDLGYLYTPDEIALLHTRSHVLMAARALGIENPIDGVYSDVRNEEGFTSLRPDRAHGRLSGQEAHPPQPDRAHEPHLCSVTGGTGLLHTGRRSARGSRDSRQRGRRRRRHDGRYGDDLHSEARDRVGGGD